MIVVDFTPTNAEAKATFAQTASGTHFITNALSAKMPDTLGSEPWVMHPLEPGELAEVEAATGPLSATVRAGLHHQPAMLVHCRAGRVVIYLRGTNLDPGHRVADALMPVLNAASLTAGQWTMRVYSRADAIAATNRDHLYRTHRLKLPIPSDAQESGIAWVEGALADAVYAAMLSHARGSGDPASALRKVPLRRNISAAAMTGVMRHRHADSVPGLDLVTYTNVSFESNIHVVGHVPVGRGITTGNGLLFRDDG